MYFMDFKHRPGWTSYAERWIDLDRGTSAYSKAMNRRQGLFFYKKTDAKLIKIWPHLNTTQSMEYIASNVFCHYSMLSIRQRIVFYLTKLHSTATPSYMHNHPEFILPDLLKLGYPVVQRRGILPYRTLLDRQKMTDFTKQQMEKSFRYGMSEGYNPIPKEYIKEYTLNKLRSIAFASPSK